MSVFCEVYYKDHLPPSPLEQMGSKFSGRILETFSMSSGFVVKQTTPNGGNDESDIINEICTTMEKIRPASAEDIQIGTVWVGWYTVVEDFRRCFVKRICEDKATVQFLDVSGHAILAWDKDLYYMPEELLYFPPQIINCLWHEAEVSTRTSDRLKALKSVAKNFETVSLYQCGQTVTLSGFQPVVKIMDANRAVIHPTEKQKKRAVVVFEVKHEKTTDAEPMEDQTYVGAEEGPLSTKTQGVLVPIEDEAELLQNDEEEFLPKDEEELLLKDEAELLQKDEKELFQNDEEESLQKGEEELLQNDNEESLQNDEEESLQKDEAELLQKDEEESLQKNEAELLQKDEEELLPKDEAGFLPKDEEELLPKDEAGFLPKDEEELLPKDEEESLQKGEEELLPKDEEESLQKGEEELLPKDEEELLPKDEEELLPKDEAEFLHKDEEELLQNDEEESLQNDEENLVQNDEETSFQKDEEELVQNNEEKLLRKDEEKLVQNNEENLVQNDEEELLPNVVNNIDFHEFASPPPIQQAGMPQGHSELPDSDYLHLFKNIVPPVMADVATQTDVLSLCVDNLNLLKKEHEDMGAIHVIYGQQLQRLQEKIENELKRHKAGNITSTCPNPEVLRD